MLLPDIEDIKIQELLKDIDTVKELNKVISIARKKKKLLQPVKQKKEKKPRKKKEHNQVVVVAKEKPCKKCSSLMERRKHKVIGEKHLKKAFYYSEWDYCTSCNFLQHYDEYKVWNNNEIGNYLKEKQELKRGDKFIKEICG